MSESTNIINRDLFKTVFGALAFCVFVLSLVVGCGEHDSAKAPESFVLGDNDYLIDCDPAGNDSVNFACQLAYYTNRERMKHQEESDQAEYLDWSDDLARVALEYSRRMCDEGFFDHNDPQGHGMENRLQKAGVFYIKAGENLARGNDLLPSEAMVLFMNEPSCEVNHRGNVLDNDFTHTGIGTVFCGDHVFYTQLFAVFEAELLRDDNNEFCLSS